MSESVVVAFEDVESAEEAAAAAAAAVGRKPTPGGFGW